MKAQARVIVVGGGVVGVSTLYHLARMGWSDCILLERKELTSGSTWHAAGLLPLFNLSYSVSQLHKYSVALYKTLQSETGQDVGFRQVSNIRLACTPDRMDEYRYYAGIAHTLDVNVRFLTPNDVKTMWPLCRIDGVIGAIQHPGDGYIQPADLTQALARGARMLGAKIYRNTAALSFTQLPGGEWSVLTTAGSIRCEHLVFATGSFARRTGALVGLEIPVLPVQHQYLVTAPHPEIVRRRQVGLPELAVLREPDASYYMREENGGLLLGPYERGAPCCYLDGPDDASEYELFEGALDRLMPHIDAAINRVPAFGEVGIKRVYNGAIPYTPDGSPIIGPAWDRRNLWLNEGHSFGITAAGGAGWQLAQWIIEGEPSIDMAGVDPRRFGSYATGRYLQEKAEEAYQKVFTIHFPDEEREAGRPLRCTPVYDRLKAMGAVYGSTYGWERPGWFAPAGYQLSDADLNKPDVLLNSPHDHPTGGTAPRERWSFRRSNYFELVGDECRHVRDAVGLIDMTPFAKFRVHGAGAETWLNHVFANRMPRRTGGLALCHLLTPRGGVCAEATIYRESDASFYLVMAGALERHDWDCLQRLLPAHGDVQLSNITSQIGVFAIAGPSARNLLQPLTDSDLSNAGFPWLTGRRICIGNADVLALRVNFVGELGWELHHTIETQLPLFDLLFDAGGPLDLRPFGTKALDSMRIEKSYRVMGRELSPEYSAIEAGLGRFLHFQKGDFIGRAALEGCGAPAKSNRFVTLHVLDSQQADARGSEPIIVDGRLVGRTTSGGYGWRVEKSLALGMVAQEYAEYGTQLDIAVLGEMRSARVIAHSPYDCENSRPRA